MTYTGINGASFNRIIEGTFEFTDQYFEIGSQATAN
jgi:hypothetical protein